MMKMMNHNRGSMVATTRASIRFLLAMLLVFASVQMLALANAEDQQSSAIYDFNSTTGELNREGSLSVDSSVSNGRYFIAWILGTKTTGGTFVTVSTEISVNNTVMDTPEYRWSHHGSSSSEAQVYLETGSVDPCSIDSNNGTLTATFSITEAITNATSGSLLQLISIESLPIVRVNGSVNIGQVISCFGFPADSPSSTPSISESATITPTMSESISATPTISESISATPTISESVSATPSEPESITPTATISETPSISITPSPEVEDSSDSSSGSGSESSSGSGSGSGSSDDGGGFKRKREVNDDDDNTICTTNSYFGLDFSNAANIAPPLKVVLTISTSAGVAINKKINRAIVAGGPSCRSHHSASQVNVTYFDFDFDDYEETQATLRFDISNPGASKLWYLWLDYDPVYYNDDRTEIIVDLRLANQGPAVSGSSWDDDWDDGGLPKGLIALFVILGVIIVCLLAAAVILVIRRRRANFAEIV